LTKTQKKKIQTKTKQNNMAGMASVLLLSIFLLFQMISVFLFNNNNNNNKLL